jgi:hypothetical protein
VAVTAAEICLESFRTYLVEERGLSAGTVAVDLRIARCSWLLDQPMTWGSSGSFRPRLSSS